MPAPSDFRRKKLLHVFEVFFDTNKNGSIDRDDFDIAIKNVCFYRGWHDDDRSRETKKRYLQIWESLKDQAAKADSGMVSPEEWYNLWSDPMNIQSWQQNYMNNMFALLDTSGDGVVDIMEYCSMYSCYGIDPTVSKKAYLLLSKGNQATVNKEYFQSLWHDYFYGEDPAAPGTFLFGKVEY